MCQRCDYSQFDQPKASTCLCLFLLNDTLQQLIQYLWLPVISSLKPPLVIKLRKVYQMVCLICRSTVMYDVRCVTWHAPGVRWLYLRWWTSSEVCKVWQYHAGCGLMVDRGMETPLSRWILPPPPICEGKCGVCVGRGGCVWGVWGSEGVCGECEGVCGVYGCVWGVGA